MDANATGGCSPVGAFQPGELIGNTQCCPGGDSQDKSGAATVGEPIDVASGNVAYEVLDYTTTGQNPLQFARYYNSRGQSSGSLGQNWRSTYDRFIDIQVQASTDAAAAPPSGVSSGSAVIISRKSGQQLPFQSVGTVWAAAHPGIDYTLSQSGSTWTLTDSDDTVETYERVQFVLGTLQATRARLVSIKKRNGYMQTLSYNSLNQLASVTDSYGRTLKFTYTNGLLTSLTTPDNTKFTYSYNSNRTLSAAASPVDANGAPTYSYFYENTALPEALTRITDKYGERINNWTYDGYARGLSNWQGDSNTKANLVTVAYNDVNGTRSVTNAFGATDTYIFATLQSVPKVVKITRAVTPTSQQLTKLFSYDGNGYLANATDWNGAFVVSHLNDTHGQPHRISEGYTRTTTITYDSTFPHLPSTIATDGLTISFTYDKSGNVLTETLKDTTANAAPYSTNGQTRTWAFEHDATGLLLTVRNARTDVNAKTTFGYDPDGALVSITNALGQVTSVTAHTGGGYPLSIKDPNGVVTTLAYDGQMRLTSSAIATTAGKLTTQYAYRFGDLVEKVTRPDGAFFSLGFDSALRPVSVGDASGNSILYTLDALGNATQTVTYVEQSVLTRKHSATFDALGRMLTDVGGMGQTTTYTYDNDGNATNVADPMRHPTETNFDMLNRVKQITDAARGITLFSYDAHDRPLSVTDPNGNATNYVYDGFGDMIQQSNPDSGLTVYRYDENGNLTSKTDAANIRTNYTYDALDRILTAAYPSDSTLNVTYRYDEPGHDFGVGRLTSLTDAAGALSRSYDERGNLLSEQRTSGGTHLTTSYGYDSAGRIAFIAYPSGIKISYSRDANGNISAMGFDAPNSSTKQVLSQVTYLPFGPVSSLLYFNGDEDRFSYDLDYRRTAQTTGPPDANRINLQYAYDADDNVSSITDQLNPNRTQTFSYDALHRLTHATAHKFYRDISWTYDSNGNIISRTEGRTATYRIGPNSNRLSGFALTAIPAQPATDLAFAYTATGNIGAMSQDGREFLKITYNAANRLASAGGEGLWEDSHFNITSLVYDAFGKRFSKTADGGSPTLFVYDQDGNLIEEHNGQGTTDYIYLEGVNVGNWSSSRQQLYAVHADRLGVPQLVRDGNGNTAWEGFTAPYGRVIIIVNAAPPVGPITQNLRLPGQYFDSESEFHYNGFRDYIPRLFDRYIESDPIGIEGGLNTYEYASANPINNTDRDGRAGEGWIIRGIPWVIQGCTKTPQGIIVCTGAFAGYLLYRACQAAVHRYQQSIPLSLPAVTPDDVAEQCDKQLEADLETCAAQGRRGGKEAYRICEKAARERYGNCLAGREPVPPLPPFNR